MTGAGGLAGMHAEHTQHPTRGPATRLSWRGWQVDLGERAVWVPVQHSTGKNIDDLGALLDAAHRILDIPVAGRPAHQRALRSGLPVPVAAELLRALCIAQRLADRHWNRTTFDLYACTGRAWQEAGMRIPYALVLTTLRAALPQPGTSLADFNHSATHATIHALYDHAFVLCHRRHTVPASRIA